MYVHLPLSCTHECQDPQKRIASENRTQDLTHAICVTECHFYYKSNFPVKYAKIRMIKTNKGGNIAVGEPKKMGLAISFGIIPLVNFYKESVNLRAKIKNWTLHVLR